MRIHVKHVAFVLSVLALSARAIEAQPRASDITSALAAGMKAKEPVYAVAYSGTMTTAGKGFRVVATGPLNRVHNLAFLNARKYLPFTVDSIPDAAVSDVVEFVATPNAPNPSRGGMQITGAATHLVLRAKGGAPIQPDSVRTFEETWSNAMGGKFTGQGIKAYFARAKLPVKEFDALVIAGADEYKAGFPAIMVARIR